MTKGGSLEVTWEQRVGEQKTVHLKTEKGFGMDTGDAARHPAFTAKIVTKLESLSPLPQGMQVGIGQAGAKRMTSSRGSAFPGA